MWSMDSRVYEQTLMFLTISIFFMMMSSYKLLKEEESSQSRTGFHFFRTRISNPKYSNNWKFVFIGLRYIQAVVLLFLFYVGVKKINTLQNLGYMSFFIVYTAYEWIYRKTAKLLILFISYFILGQYIFSFAYTKF